MDDTVWLWGYFQLSYTVTGPGSFLNTAVGTPGSSYLDWD